MNLTPSAKQKLILFFVCVIALCLLAALSGCAVKYPLPPTGENAGRYGYIEARVSYVPNLQTAIDFFSPNPVIPSTLNDK